MQIAYLLYTLNDLIIYYAIASNVNDCLSKNYSTFSEAIIIGI